MTLWAFSGGAQNGISFATMIEGVEDCTHTAGISAGAMMSLYVALQDKPNIPQLKGEISKCSHHYLKRWSHSKVLNAIKAYFYHNSIYQSGSLFNLANVALDLSPSEELKKDITLGIWDATCMRYKEFTFRKETKRKELLKYVQASASVPLLFPPQEIEGHWMRDGVWHTSFRSNVSAPTRDWCTSSPLYV